MRRKTIVASLLLCLFASLSCQAQTRTVVSGTITDPNGVPYSGGTIDATLVPTGVTPTVLNNNINGYQVPVPIDASGNFSMSLYCNTAGGGCDAISPSGTQWLFTVRNPGAVPPVGFGGVSFTATITITGATQNISTQLQTAAPLLLVGTGSVAPNAVVSASTMTTGDVIIGLTGSGKRVQDSGVLLSSLATNAAIALLAPLASPALTGTPTAPTCTPGDSSTQVTNDACLTAALTASAATVERILSVNTTAVTAGATTTAAQPLMSAASPIAAGALNALKKTVRFHSSGPVVNQAGSTNLNVQFFIDGTTSSASATVTPFSPIVNQWSMDLTCTTTATGAAGSLFCYGNITFASTTGTQSQVFTINQSVVGVNLTAAMTPSNSAAFNTANPTNIITQSVLLVEQLN